MTFVSVAFGLFFCVVFVAYWTSSERSVRLRNGALSAANLAFYATWDLRSIPLLLCGITAVYGVGRAMGATASRRGKALWLAAGVLMLLGPLAYFKYGTFLAHVVAAVVPGLGSRQAPSLPSPMLPLGISFLTCAALSYLIDVRRGTIAAERDYPAFLAYLSFFPVVVAGPIERGTTLLPQLTRRGVPDDGAFADGVRQFLWGAVKKVAVADTLAVIVDPIFLHHAQAGGGELAIGAVLFSLQIYCDFSGYSEMAMGVARCLGIELTRNFACPYFSRDIAEFWRRWHVSLSSWFRDYVFFPLGANYRGRGRWVVNLLVTFAACGLWHGANWTFVIWGVVVGLYFVPLVVWPPARRRPRVVAKGRLWPTAGEAARMALTFGLVTLAWIPFRAASAGAALAHVVGLASRSWFSYPVLDGVVRERGLAGGLIAPVLLSAGVFVVEWLQREQVHGLAVDRLPAWLRWSAYYVLAAILILSFSGTPVRFLYADF